MSYVCPVCGEELDYNQILYKRDDEIIGCSNCLNEMYAEDCFENDEHIICEACGAKVGEGEKILLNSDEVIVGCDMCCRSIEVWIQAEEDDELARDHYEQMLVDEYLGK